MHIIVEPYHPSWGQKYEEEAVLIKEILKYILVDIHHIGSTAVPGLAAKPVIDIMPVVTDIKAVDKYNKEFEKLGYECMGEYGIHGRRYYRKGGDERTHQIHIFESGNHVDIDRHLAVRDYLRTHQEVVAEYGELKKALAEKYPEDIESYCNGKDDFLKRLEQKAIQIETN